MTLNINLTAQLEELVRKKVSSGRYNSASEVIREALRLMEAQDQLQAVRLGQMRQDTEQTKPERRKRPAARPRLARGLA